MATPCSWRVQLSQIFRRAVSSVFALSSVISWRNLGSQLHGCRAWERFNAACDVVGGAGNSNGPVIGTWFIASLSGSDSSSSRSRFWFWGCSVIAGKSRSSSVSIAEFSDNELEAVWDGYGL